MSGSRGATIIEAAIIAPVLFVLLFGILEAGFLFRDYLTIGNTTREGAREASVAANDGLADFRALAAIERASSALPDAAIAKIIIFKATGPGDTVPAGCLAGAVTGLCNVYSPADFALTETDFGCDTVLPDPDSYWCPSDREVSISTGQDYIGIYVDMTHKAITGLFGDTVDLQDTTVFKLEAQKT